MAQLAPDALPQVEWRRFSGNGPVRQWIALPAFGDRLVDATRHLRRRLLVEFREAGVWLFECALDYHWPQDVLVHAARILHRHARRPTLFPRRLQRDLSEVIDCLFSVSRPDVGTGHEAFWNTRALAVNHLLGLALPAGADRASPANLGALAAREAERVQQQLDAELARISALFRAHLDPDGVSLCSSDRLLHLEAYNQWASLDRDGQRNRRQFAAAFPMLACGMNPSAVGFPAGFTDAIDRGVPIADYLARAYCVRKGTVRWLVGKQPEEIGAHWQSRPARLLALLDALAPQDRPASKADWDRVNLLIEAAERDALRPVSPAIVALWLRTARRPAHACQPERIDAPDWLRGARELNEFWAELDDCLRVRASTTHTCSPPPGRQQLRALADRALAGRNWQTAVALAQRWRAAKRAAGGPIGAARAELLGNRFPALLPGDWLVGERLMVPLLSAEALDAEGRSMGHCVGSYLRACASGDSLIVSLRDFSSGRHCSTAEFRIRQPRPGPVQLDLRQHSGPANSVPCAACQSAVASLLARASSDPLLQAHWKATLQRSAIRNRMPPTEASRLAAILAQEEAFRQVLPGEKGYDGLLEALRGA